MNVTQSYSIAHLNIRVKFDDELFGDKITRALGDYFSFQRHNYESDSPHITLLFNEIDEPFKTPVNVQELFTSPRLRVLKNGNTCYVIDEESYFQLELSDCIGIGHIDNSFWDRPPKLQQEFLSLSFLWLLHMHGLYAIHGNALVLDEFAIMLAGDTCSGKSTTALSLIRKGWHYLSDDVTLLKNNSPGVAAVAFLKGFSFNPQLADHYSEFSEIMKSSSLNGQKRFADIGTVYPGKFQYECVPKVMIFPQIVSQDKSRLIPIDKTSVLIMLMQYSGGIMVSKEMASQQTELLKALTYQTSSYQLNAGRDLYENPGKISDILAKV